MARNLLLALLSAIFISGFSAILTPPALAANCDVNACISACSKRCPTPGCGCASGCLQTIEGRKKAGQCK